MCSTIKTFATVFAVALLSFSMVLRADEDDDAKPVDNSVVPAVDSLPEFSLKDPAGNVHTNAELAGKKAVIVVTVPTKEQGDNQKAWVNGIVEQNAGAGKDYMLVLVQDMTQSGSKDMALDGMKKKWNPGNPTLILIDDKGEFRSSLESQRGTLTDKTSLLIYDEKGKLIHFNRNKATLTAVSAVHDKLANK